mmetsp:Transcript_5983/g.10919  ORF Transcript_5983/g.10919 Transcript_5983/m.10919 type:complete len:109 (+) Transcript_5983:417-743(+)
MTLQDTVWQLYPSPQQHPSLNLSRLQVYHEVLPWRLLCFFSKLNAALGPFWLTPPGHASQPNKQSNQCTNHWVIHTTECRVSWLTATEILVASVERRVLKLWTENCFN